MKTESELRILVADRLITMPAGYVQRELVHAMASLIRDVQQAERAATLREVARELHEEATEGYDENASPYKALMVMAEHFDAQAGKSVYMEGGK